VRAFAIVKTKELLIDFASEHDGMCKVVRSIHGPMAVPPDKELNGTGHVWDYYMCDEPDCFDFEKYGIAQ
jgi:hypothetical protein